jgi:hypothetical protein
MATRSRLGIILDNASIVSVYCHYDGYPEHTGRILKEHYTTKESVTELIDGGSISSLRTRSTWKSGSPLRDDSGEYIFDDAGYLTYANDRSPQPLYYTERGEEIEVSCTSLTEFWSGNSCEEYTYLFHPSFNTWICHSIGHDNKVKEVEIP